MNSTVNGYVVCPHCPAVYSREEITAVYGEEHTTMAHLSGSREQTQVPRRKGGLAALVRRPVAQSPARRPEAAPEPDFSAVGRLRAYTFLCPREHVVSGNRGRPLPIAVVGANGASKSHFLPGLIFETKTMQALSRIGVRVSEAAYTGAGLGNEMNRIYVGHEVLPTTPEGTFNGPYSYNLEVGYNPTSQHSLQLFDVSGEELGSIVKIGENARFILVSRAIFLLVDPRRVVATKFDSAEKPPGEIERLIAGERSREGIRRIAEALREVWGREDCRDLGIPFVVVVAKADSIEWDFDWQAEQAHVGAPDPNNPGGLRESLAASSDRVRGAFEAVGGAAIIREVYDCFGDASVRYVASSATSEMPSRGGVGNEADAQWVSPKPAGAALALLHALDLLGETGADEDRGE